MIRFAGESGEESPKQPENPDVLFMPEDPTGEISRRLTIKAEQYRERLKEWIDKTQEERDAYAKTQLTHFDPFLDSLYKLMIAETLLDEDFVDLGQVKNEIIKQNGSIHDLTFENAWKVIRGYITGSGGVSGGRGF